jgi:hypothetical protein
MKKTFLTIIFSCIFIYTSFSQGLDVNTIPQNYYLNPLDLKLFLSGTFGEIRSNHFHSGIDIRTNQREGYPVYASADGFISRLRVQIGGFGNAVYIAHPNGTTSVYAHLQKFNERISLAVKNNQYLKKSFAVDFPLTPIEIPVKKGDIIAWSGNTGSSGGPHLHFEIRDSKTEQTINPLTLGIRIEDTVKPAINGFYIYKVNNDPFSELTKKQYFQTTGGNGKYSLNQVNVVNVSGKFGFGIMANDQQNNNSNKNGIFSTTILLDNKKIFETVIDQLFFDHTRSVNAYIDYPAKLSQGRVIEKGFALPGAKTSFYREMNNYGLIELTDSDLHDVKYILKDANGNESVLNFKIRNSGSISPEKTPVKGKYFNYLTDNSFSNEDIKVNFPKGIFYDDLDFIYNSSPKTANSLSKIHHVHNKLTPVHQGYELQIKVDSSLLNIKDKLLVVNENGASQGGEFFNGYIKANPRMLGKFYLKSDVIAPVIVPVNTKEGANLSKEKRISLRISDNLSGIKSFDGYIDNNWVLMEYEQRNDSIWHTFDSRTGFGKHTFKLVVTDMKNNIKTYSINFFR